METGDIAAQGDGVSVADALRDAANVLVLSDGTDPDARASYYETLLPAAADLRVLAVEYTRGPDGWLGEWRTNVGAPPAETAIISVDDGTRSAAATPADPIVYEGDGTGTVISTVESADDLTGLGIAVSSHLKRWRPAAGPTTLVTLDSLTVLLQYVDLKRAFRFLHVMVNRVKKAGAIGHYHMDPAAHDEQTVATLASVFDAVARHEDGGWQVTTR